MTVSQLLRQIKQLSLADKLKLQKSLQKQIEDETVAPTKTTTTVQPIEAGRYFLTHPIFGAFEAVSSSHAGRFAVWRLRHLVNTVYEREELLERETQTGIHGIAHRIGLGKYEKR